MIDDILRGALTGILSVPLARWAAKYKYRTVFFLCWTGTNLFLFFSFLKVFGFFKAPIIFLERIASPIGIFLPLGIGILGTTLVFIYTLGKSRKN